MYKILTSQMTGEQTVFLVEDNSWTTVTNPTYLAWVAEGNTAEEWQPE
jgi:hypothetical protein